MADKLSEAQQKLMAYINDPVAARVFGATLAEIAVELMDAKAEAAHWKKSLDTVSTEIKVLAAVAMKQRGETRLVITRKELAEFNDQDTELHVGTPEPGVRIYELRQKCAAVDAAVSKIIRPH